MTTILSSLASAARAAATYNPNAQAAPACILWPDGGRQFESVLPQLREALPELLALGAFDPATRTGPVEWLRCAMAGTIEVPGLSVPEGCVPILYLPGVSRADLRVAESLPKALRPLAYYAFRGCFFSQRSGRDWTAAAFLCTKDGGLGLDLASDDASLSALRAALPRVLALDPATLRGRRLDKDEWNALLTGGDPDREMLQWLSGGDAWRKAQGEDTWKALRELAKSRYGLDPEKDGRDEALKRLADRKGQWKALFERYEESFQAYPGILPALQAIPAPQFGLFDTVEEIGGWPQWNEEEEKKLRGALAGLDGKVPATVAKEVADLEKTHRPRRSLPWAGMGLSPLALALEPLSRLARCAQKMPPAAASLGALAAWYDSEGWKADAAAWEAVAAAAGNTTNETAVKGIVATLYKPWLEACALVFQKLAEADSAYAGRPTTMHSDKGTLFLFADGLRLDVAERLAQRLAERGFETKNFHRWAPIPSLTEVGKPAAVPCKPADLVCEDGAGSFDPLKASGTTFAKWLEKNGLVPADGGDGAPASSSCRWREFKDNLDDAGHTWTENLPKRIPSALDELVAEVERAFDEGSRSVRIVTDHGWLLLPGGLPKESLQKELAEEKRGRWARLKPGVKADGKSLPWSWTAGGDTAYFARGICCHRAGMSYTHGGLSLQECRLLELEISDGRKADATALRDVSWSGVRLHCTVAGDVEGCKVDLRKDPLAEDSLLARPAVPGTDGKASALVADEDLYGSEAHLVVLGPDGAIRSQRKLHIGG